MIEFNLERALAGDAVVTRDGREVTQVVKFDIFDDIQVHGVVEMGVEQWFANGNYYSGGRKCGADLFMAPKKLSGFVNVYRDSDGFLWFGSHCDSVKVAARNRELEDDSRVACIDLSTIEEGHGL